MKTLSLKNSSWRRSSAWARGVAMASLAVGAWALSVGTAHARGGDADVYWSVGVSQPGVSVGVSNMPPPRVVVMQPRPVVIERPVVVERPVRYERRVVVVREPVYYRGYGPRWQKHHWKARHGHPGYRGDRWDDRYERRDDRRDHRRDGGRR